MIVMKGRRPSWKFQKETRRLLIRRQYYRLLLTIELLKEELCIVGNRLLNRLSPFLIQRLLNLDG